MIQKKFRQLIDDVSIFLLGRQIRISDIVLSPKSGNIIEKKIVPYDSGTFFLEEFKFESEWHYKKDNAWIPIPLGTPFRLCQERRETTHTETESADYAAQYRGMFGKILRYRSYHDFFPRSWSYIRKKCNPFIWYERVRYGALPTASSSLAEEGGITFIAQQSDRSRDITLVCLDAGGIFDTNINSEGHALPPQVPVDCYSTEYAAYCFYWQWRHSGEGKWKEACIDAINFFVQASSTPYTWTMFDHYEFKVLPLSALLLEIEKDDVTAEFSIDALRKKITARWYEYDPVNVAAMRVANAVLCHKVNIPYGKRKYAASVKRVLKNQTIQGLIQDNTGGAVRHSADLTYHQFALACLCVAQAYTPDKRIEGIISRALACSRYIQRPDGHVSFFGRGANNVYHLASYIYAESCATDTKIQGIEKLITNIHSFFDSERGLPTALNKHHEARMGWNHCAMPYNGQSLFFLCLAYTNIFEQKKASIVVSPSTPSSVASGYVVLQNSTFHAVIGRGADQYVWGEGTRFIGMGGLCALSVDGVSVLLANDFSIKNNIWTSDLPQQAGTYAIFDTYCARLTHPEDSMALLTGDGFSATYTCTSDAFTMEYMISPSSQPVDCVGALSFLDTEIERVEEFTHAYHIFFKHHATLVVSAPDLGLTLQKRRIVSNSFGTGVQYYWQVDEEVPNTEARYRIIMTSV